MITKDEILQLLHSTETYRVERTTSTVDMDKFQEAICAFSNDLPNSRHRNPIVAEAMKEMKYVNMFNQGIRRVQDMLRDNGNPEAEFTVNKITAFEVTVRPTMSLNLVTDQEKVTKLETKMSETVNDILAFCSTPRSMTEIMEHIGLKHRYNVKHRYIDPLIEAGFIEMTIPDKPNSRSQKYKRVLT